MSPHPLPPSDLTTPEPYRSSQMITVSQQVHCPNCGHLAERYHLESDHLIRTQCSACDYLLITCSLTGKVIEAYAPGLFVGSAS